MMMFSLTMVSVQPAIDILQVSRMGDEATCSQFSAAVVVAVEQGEWRRSVVLVCEMME
jgi:hypothetical protein